MSNIETKSSFLESLLFAISEAEKATLGEIEALVEMREAYFGGNMQQILNIAPSLVATYDQMVRDKRVVARRYRVFANKVSTFTAETLTDMQESLLRLEALGVTHHAQAVAEFCDELETELRLLDKAMEQMRSLLDSFGGKEDSDTDLLDNDGDEHSDERYPF
jgi:DNA-directed RNA polymerase subunit F